jgi:hypothetical protein
VYVGEMRTNRQAIAACTFLEMRTNRQAIAACTSTSFAYCGHVFVNLGGAIVLGSPLPARRLLCPGNFRAASTLCVPRTRTRCKSVVLAQKGTRAAYVVLFAKFVRRYNFSSLFFLLYECRKGRMKARGGGQGLREGEGRVLGLSNRMRKKQKDQNEKHWNDS